ncbi:MAG: hypothetical protein DRI84_05050 [Bacteroidetes bacterium]|nr:MAG: hypothetical protein DRI84_05050 [Bacteroidota bacterium]
MITNYSNKEYRLYTTKAIKQIMCNIARAINAQVYVELGLRRFNTINLLVDVVPRCIGIDVLDKWYKQGLCDKRVEFYNMTTDEFYKYYNENINVPIDLLFIDAKHTYAQSYKDFLNYKNLVSDNGIILLHDSFPPTCKYSNSDGDMCGEVWKTAIKIKESHSKECELCTIPGGFGLSIIRMNHGRQVSWI